MKELINEMELWLLNRNVQNVRQIREWELQHMRSLLDQEEDNNG